MTPEDPDNKPVAHTHPAVVTGTTRSQMLAGASWSPFQWTPIREQAAELLIVDELSDMEICAKLDIGARTLYDWKLIPEFSERIAEGKRQIRERIRNTGLAIVENRIRAKTRRHAKLERVIDERAAAAVKAQDAGLEVFPGETTGLVVRKRRSVGSGENAEIFEEVFVDDTVLKELRAHEVEIAQELGQWKADEPSSVVVQADKAAVTLAAQLTPAELEALRLRLEGPGEPAEVEALKTEPETA